MVVIKIFLIKTFNYLKSYQTNAKIPTRFKHRSKKLYNQDK